MKWWAKTIACGIAGALATMMSGGVIVLTATSGVDRLDLAVLLSVLITGFLAGSAVLPLFVGTRSRWILPVLGGLVFVILGFPLFVLVAGTVDALWLGEFTDFSSLAEQIRYRSGEAVYLAMHLAFFRGGIFLVPTVSVIAAVMLQRLLMDRDLT